MTRESKILDIWSEGSRQEMGKLSLSSKISMRIVGMKLKKYFCKQKFEMIRGLTVKFPQKNLSKVSC